MGFLDTIKKKFKGKPDIEKLKQKKDVDGLIEALSYSSGNAKTMDADFNLEGMAAKALGEVGDPRAIPALQKQQESLLSFERSIEEMKQIAPSAFRFDPELAADTQRSLLAAKAAYQETTQALKKLSAAKPAQSLEKPDIAQPTPAPAPQLETTIVREYSAQPPFNYRTELDKLFKANPQKQLGRYEVITLEYEYGPKQALPRMVVGNAWTPILAGGADVHVFVRNVLCKIDPQITVYGMSGVYMQYVLDFESRFLEVQYLSQERRVFRLGQRFVDRLLEAVNTPGTVILVDFLNPNLPLRVEA